MVQILTARQWLSIVNAAGSPSMTFVEATVVPLSCRLDLLALEWVEKILKRVWPLIILKPVACQSTPYCT